MAKFRLLRAAKFLIYAVILLLLFLMTAAPHLFAINGIRPMLIIPFFTVIAIFEGELAGVIFAFAGGLLCDFLSSMPFGFNAAIFMFFALMTGLLTTYLLRRTIVSALFFTFICAVIRAGVEYYLLYAMWGYSHSALIFTGKLLPVALYTAATALIIFFIVKFIHGRFERLLKI